MTAPDYAIAEPCMQPFGGVRFFTRITDDGGGGDGVDAHASAALLGNSLVPAPPLQERAGTPGAAERNTQAQAAHSKQDAGAHRPEPEPYMVWHRQEHQHPQPRLAHQYQRRS